MFIIRWYRRTPEWFPEETDKAVWSVPSKRIWRFIDYKVLSDYVSAITVELVSVNRSLFPVHAIPDAFIKQYLENVVKMTEKQLLALKEVADLFDSMRKKDKDLINEVQTASTCTHINHFISCNTCR